MTNPVRQTRLKSALVAYRERRHPYFCPNLTQALIAFFRTYGITMNEEDTMDFWLWFTHSSPFARDAKQGISNFTHEEILWGVERFIEEFSPIDGDFESEV